MKKRLGKDVLRLVLEKTGSSSGKAIGVRIAELRRKYSGLTPKAAAQLHVEKFGKSIMYKLDDEDRQSLQQAKAHQSPPRIIYVPKPKKGGATRQYLKRLSTDKFEQKHIDEINKAYNADCYTAVYVLCRKVIENLIIRLLQKNPLTKPKADLYWDKGRARFNDFSLIIRNLGLSEAKFPPPVQKAVRRLSSRAKVFAKNANDQTHSLFYIAKKKDLDDAEIEEIFELISEIDKTL